MTEPTLEQKWIDVLVWAGWKPEVKEGEVYYPLRVEDGQWRDDIIYPPMSLDAVHEIKKKLTDNQLANYSDHIDAIMERSTRRNKFMPWKAHRELAEVQHCIDALWRTVRG